MTTELSTADQVLQKLKGHNLKKHPNGQYRCNSPFRTGSDSNAFSLTITGPEHGAFKDFASDEGGSLYQLAAKLGIEVPQSGDENTNATTKRSYATLADYAAAHYTPEIAYTSAGWKYEIERGDSSGNKRPALMVPTATGPRYRFVDGAKPLWRSPSGYKRCWYRLHEAIDLANAQQSPLILCNGEPSTIAAQYHQVPATAITGGAEQVLPADMLSELKTAWSGPIIVALDCDKKGRDAAALLVRQLQAAGYVASAVDMRGSDGFDLADWCGLHTDTALTDLLACQVPTSLDPVEEYHCSDLGNARRLVHQHGADLRYVEQWGWLVWDGRRWRIDDTGEVNRRAQKTALGIYDEAADAPEHRKRDIAKWAMASHSHSKLRAMIMEAESQIEVRATPEQFDTNDWRLSCANGTIDLTTGDLLPHDRSDMLTRTIAASYNARAACPRWRAFLDRIFDGNQALIGYVQRMIGYMLTGSTGAQCMFIAYGNGANGKSVLIDVIRALLGDYARNADPSTFLSTQAERIRSDLARLAGVRFVSTVELDEGRRLSEALVKQVTGGDVITARFLNKNEFEFTPRFKLLMATNHKPIIRGTDLAIWRRIKLIPFNITIPENERDPRLAEKLKTELPGILSWAVQGCLAWQKNGLQEPTEVSAATNEYRSEMDVIGQFVDENCLIGTRFEVTCAELYAAYTRWCDEGGERGVNQRRFGSQMSERGYDRQRRRSGWYYVGIGLITDRYIPDNHEPKASQDSKSEAVPRDLCDPCDPIFPILHEEKSTMKKPGKLDHMDHIDHTPNGTPIEHAPAVNIEYVRRLLALGDESAIMRHCTLAKADYEQVIAAAQREAVAQ